MKASVVIGANLGDEGKGLVTDWLSDAETTVIRFNGGAQAGHTVQNEAGMRHVFSHVGAGLVRGAQTFLSKHFILNPSVFRKEMEELESKTTKIPSMSFDYRCRFTTPWDMVINREVEQMRAAARHGSVGLGFGETIERYEQLGLSLSLSEYHKCKNDLNTFMVNSWVPARAKDLGIESRIEYIQDTFSNKDFLNKFSDDVGYLLTKITPNSYRVGDAMNIVSGNRTKRLVMEGAQGLLLDQNFGTFPHVTRSNTGLMNVADIAPLMHITKLDVYYVTRCYLTRHGAGPLENELPEAPVANFEDKTNQPNPFQGALRFAPLNLNKLRERIDRDLKWSKLEKQLNLVVTCIDQIAEDDKIPVVIDGEIKELYYYELMGEMMCFFPEFIIYVSEGPTRKDIKEWFV